jgi:hypothetical protein
LQSERSYCLYRINLHRFLQKYMSHHSFYQKIHWQQNHFLRQRQSCGLKQKDSFQACLALIFLDKGERYIGFLPPAFTGKSIYAIPPAISREILNCR